MEKAYSKIKEVMNSGNYTSFAYNGCHKIYILENENETKEAENLNYEIKNISELLDTYKKSCNLRFVQFWNLDKDAVVPQTFSR